VILSHDQNYALWLHTEIKSTFLSESESRLLNVLKKTRRVTESGVAIGESGSPYSNFLKFIITLNGYTIPLKDQFGKKEARDVIYYHH
jgi:hypothetical protein